MSKVEQLWADDTMMGIVLQNLYIFFVILPYYVGRTSFVCFCFPCYYNHNTHDRIAVGRTGSSSEHVDSHVMVLPSKDAKTQWLLEMLPILSPLGRCIVFVATRADCDLLSQMVQNSPSFAGGGGNSNASTIVAIHGDKDQRDRNSAITQFKKNAQSILIATDVGK